jgi:hypothetical protein
LRGEVWPSGHLRSFRTPLVIRLTGAGRNSRRGSTILANLGNDRGGIHFRIRREPGNLMLGEIRQILVAPAFNDGGGLGRGFAALRRHCNEEILFD